MSQKVLATGGLGFIGTNLVKHLEAGKGPAYSWQMKSSINI